MMNGGMTKAKLQLETPAKAPEEKVLNGDGDHASGEEVEAEPEMKVKKETSGVLPPLETLKCNLCQDYLNEPVTLQCLHSFCKGCLEKYNQEYYGSAEVEEASALKGDAKIEAGEEAKEETQRTVLCPVCIEQFGLLPPQEPAAPFENLRLARVVSLVESDNIVCQNCNQDTSEMKCDTCEAWLCIPCMKITHEAPIFQTHETKRLEHEKMLAPPKCPHHPLNDLEFFSTEEEVGVCQVCLLKGEFVGKPYCLVSDVRKLRQDDIEKDLDDVIQSREQLQKGQEEAREVIALLNQNLDSQTSAVKENFAAIRAALDKREAETLAALNELKDAKQNVLETQISQSQKVIDVIDDGVDSVDVVINHSNDLELVYMTVVLQDLVADLSRIGKAHFKEEMQQISYYHQPAVDEDLPVVLSDRVPQLVGAYASVPLAEEITGVSGGKSKSLGMRMTPEQKAALDEVAGAKGNADEYGCVLQ